MVVSISFVAYCVVLFLPYVKSFTLHTCRPKMSCFCGPRGNRGRGTSCKKHPIIVVAYHVKFGSFASVDVSLKMDGQICRYLMTVVRTD